MAQQTRTQTQSRPAGPPPFSSEGALVLVNKAHDDFMRIAARNPVTLRPAWEREVGFAIQSIMRSEYLIKAAQQSPGSIISAVTNLAAVGLTLNPVKQHAALVPRYNRDLGVWEAGLSAMYRGLIFLGTQAGIHDIKAEVVYEADTFDLESSEEGDKYRHKIAHAIPRNPSGDLTGPNKILGVYCAAIMPGGKLPKVEWVPAADIFKMRAQSDACWVWKDNRKTDELLPKAGWVVWFDEYAKKGAIKRAQKRWEEAMVDEQKWTFFQRAVDIDNQSEGRIFDATPEPVICLTLEQVAKIEAAVGQIGLKEPKRFIDKICESYRVTALSEIPAKFEKEILDRIAEAKKTAEARQQQKK